MSDILTAKQRTKCMRAVKGKDTKPEMIVREYLFSRGLRYRLHDKKLPGCPDIVLKKYKTIIFIDGCFWHGHWGCKYFKLPKTNEFYWEQKIRRNKARDIANQYVLQTEGWRVIRVWECEIKRVAGREEVLDSLYNRIVTIPNNYSIIDSQQKEVAEGEVKYSTGY